jgi:hypothetical protein
MNTSAVKVPPLNEAAGTLESADAGTVIVAVVAPKEDGAIGFPMLNPV